MRERGVLWKGWVEKGKDLEGPRGAEGARNPHASKESGMFVGRGKTKHRLYQKIFSHSC